jgi:arginine/lysine/ornithine decarboxylase
MVRLLLPFILFFVRIINVWKRSRGGIFMHEKADSLLSLLQQYHLKGEIPFHMPGHKRNAKLAPYLEQLSAKLDITEIPGFDDLHDPQGVLAEAMARAAKLYGSDAAFFLVNGSTGGILAGIRAATHYGNQVLVARNCHKAVYHALELCGLEPIFLKPPEIPEFGCAASLPAEMVEESLSLHPEIRLVILTSPTYEGVISDIEAICKSAHRRKIPVLVDEAHGAHLGLDETFPASAVSYGADLVVQSFHKTLPSLTQTGMLHVNNGLISREEVARQLGIFQTSSPSYLLMASLEGCVSLLEQQRNSLFAAWRQRLLTFERKINALTQVQILGYGINKQLPGVFNLDPGKLVIGTKYTNLTGVCLMEILKEQYQLQLEMAMLHYAVAMTSIGDTDKMMDCLSVALLELDALCDGKGKASGSFLDTEIPRRLISQAKAAEYPWRLVSVREGEGMICGEAIWAYPPGIPMIIPGEEFSAALLQRLQEMDRAGIRLCGTRGTPPDTLAVLNLP